MPNHLLVKKIEDVRNMSFISVYGRASHEDKFYINNNLKRNIRLYYMQLLLQTFLFAVS